MKQFLKSFTESVQIMINYTYRNNFVKITECMITAEVISFDILNAYKRHAYYEKFKNIHIEINTNLL